MNALYVTVSIPLLLVLAGFNHAHGLTTFGKSNNTPQGQQTVGSDYNYGLLHKCFMMPPRLTIHDSSAKAHYDNRFTSTFHCQNAYRRASGKSCSSQADCTVIKGTTCIDQLCLCGDNTNPKNGICKAQLKGPKHICQTDDDCVARAECLEPKEKMKPNTVAAAATFKICQCQEGFADTQAGTCSGGTNFAVLPGLLLLSMTFIKVY